MNKQSQNKQSQAKQLELLKKYRKENPYLLDDVGFDKILFDIITPRKDMVYDEYLDFLLWNNKKPGRQENFLIYLKENILPKVSGCKKIMEIGCGKSAWLSKELVKDGYIVTCVDPVLKNNSYLNKSIMSYDLYFDYKNAFCLQLTMTNDLVIAQEPCEATEHIIRACELIKTPYYIILCGAPHKRIDQIMPDSVWDWYHFLQKNAPHGTLEKTNIAGVHYYVIYCLSFESEKL